MDYMKIINDLIDGTATSYFLAYKCIMLKNHELCDYYGDKVSAYFFPAVTLAAFSCELALKYRIKNDCGKIERGHNLEKLFETLNYESRCDVVDRTIKLYNYKASILESSDLLTSVRFDSLLSNIKNAFVDWRYYFEGNAQGDIDFLEALMFCLNDVDDEYERFLRMIRTLK